MVRVETSKRGKIIFGIHNILKTKTEESTSKEVEVVRNADSEEIFNIVVRRRTKNLFDYLLNCEFLQEKQERKKNFCVSRESKPINFP